MVLVIIAVINSIIGVGYYFKLIIAMFTKESTEERQSVPFVYSAVAVVAILLNIGIGLYPELILQLIR
jgi:NADH-quinone oxidoreductase subunit N